MSKVNGASRISLQTYFRDVNTPEGLTAKLRDLMENRWSGSDENIDNMLREYSPANAVEGMEGRSIVITAEDDWAFPILGVNIHDSAEVENMRSQLRDASVSKAFAPVVTGSNIINLMRRAYEAPSNEQAIIAACYSEFNSQLETDRIPGLVFDSGYGRTKENKAYPRAQISEEFNELTSYTYGGQISFSRRMMTFDHMGIIARLATQWGREAIRFKNRVLIEALQDVPGSTDLERAVYKPDGTATALFGAGKLRGDNTQANTLADVDSIDSLRHPPNQH